jgi:nucleolar complex protein 2
MGKKATKATRKFAASGQLKKTIQARKRHQDIRKKTLGRKAGRKDFKGKQREDAVPTGDGEEEDEEDVPAAKRKGKGKGK